MSKKTEQLVEELSALTVLEMAELKKALEDKWGVQAQAAAVMAAPVAGGASAAPSAEAEASDFKVMLKEVPADKKIAVIKVVREVTNLGLKEAKDLVEGAPKEVKATAPKAEANDMKSKLEAAGAKVELIPV